jgi:two-component system LytT family response regulator
MSPLRTLIIEDNAAARAGLRERLKAHPEIAVVGEAGTVGRARTLFSLNNYDLVFLDVRLRGGLGFDLVPYASPLSRIIFVTAFDEYAIRAFEVNALDYLLKPVTPERLAASLARIAPATAEPAPARLQHDDLAHLKTDTGSHFVAVRSITVILAELNYTLVHLESGLRHLVRRPLQSWEDQLDPAGFVRVSREALVNLAHVNLHAGDGPKCGLLRLTGRKEPVHVSRRHWPLVRARLQRD